MSISSTGSGVGLVVGCASAAVADGLAVDLSGGIAHPAKINRIHAKPIAYCSILRGLISHPLSACRTCRHISKRPPHASAKGLDMVRSRVGHHFDFRWGCYGVVLGTDPSISHGQVGVNTLARRHRGQWYDLVWCHRLTATRVPLPTEPCGSVLHSSEVITQQQLASLALPDKIITAAAVPAAPSAL